MFREDKTTQMAGRFLKMADGRMPYIVLMKLLYLADKEMLLKWDKPITYDQWYSMKCGPVLSATYDLIKGSKSDSYWKRHIQTVGYDAVLEGDPGDGALSRAEDEIVDAIFAEHGGKEQWDLVNWTHDLPEWRHPGKSASKITYETVLQVEGMSAEVIDNILRNIKAQDDIAAVLRSAA
jgi:uncharacterized phage-associated protein